MKNRIQKKKVNKSYSTWRELLTGVLQESILVRIILNIIINDISFFLEEVSLGNYAVGNTTYAAEKYVIVLLKILEKDTYNVLNWFRFNEMKANQRMCHLIIAIITYKNYESNSFCRS